MALVILFLMPVHAIEGAQQIYIKEEFLSICLAMLRSQEAIVSSISCYIRCLSKGWSVRAQANPSNLATSYSGVQNWGIPVAVCRHLPPGTQGQMRNPRANNKRGRDKRDREEKKYVIPKTDFEPSFWNRFCLPSRNRLKNLFMLCKQRLRSE